MKRKFKKQGLPILVVILTVALVITFLSLVKTLLSLSGESVISIAISAFETIGLIISLIIAVRQLNDSKEIARADFLVELNRAFTESEGNLELYSALQSCIDNDCVLEKGCGGSTEALCQLRIPKVTVSNYLTFFETIYLLLCNGVISFDMIDDLFGYRFFLAVHSKFVQQMKLAPQPENFKNIFCLEYEWMKYRKEVAHKIDSENSVFMIRQLKNLLVTDEQKKIYEQWIQTRRKIV